MIDAIASGVGGLISAGIGAYSAAQERKAAQKRRDAANQYLTAWQNEAQKILDESSANRVSMSNPSDVATYQQMKASYDPSAYVYEPEKFDKSAYSVEDYLNPQREAILKDVADTVQHTAAGAGLGHSSGAVSAMVREAMAKDESLYDKAYERMIGERSFDYGAYTDYINQQQKKLDTMRQGQLDKMNMLRSDITFDQQSMDADTQNRLSLGNSIANSRAQLV